MVRISLLFLLSSLFISVGYSQNKHLTPQPAGIQLDQPATNPGLVTPVEGTAVLPAKDLRPTGKATETKNGTAIPVAGTLEPIISKRGKLQFDRFLHGFGTIKQNQTTEAVFNFTNTSTEAITLTKVETVCDCIVADYPKTPIAAGQKATIKVRFDAKNRLGKVTKSVFITTDEPKESASYTINLHGTVIKTNE